MDKIFRAFRQALRTCVDPSVIFLLFVPFLITSLIAGVLGFTVGQFIVSDLHASLSHSVVMEYMTQKWQLLSAEKFGQFSYFLIVILMLMLLLPVSYFLAVLVVSIGLMPLLLKRVQKGNFPLLEKKFGGNAYENSWKILKTSVIYVFLLVVTLPLWFIPGAMIGIPVLLGAYLGGNIFVYDVLRKFASEEERRQIEKDNRFWLFLLGVFLGLLNYLPMAFLVMPVFAGLSYSYFCLNELQELRAKKASAGVAP